MPFVGGMNLGETLEIISLTFPSIKLKHIKVLLAYFACFLL